MRETGTGVVLLAASVIVLTRGFADAAEIEPERRKTSAETHLCYAGHHRAVHVAPVEGVGVRDDDAEASARRDGKPGLEGLGVRTDRRRPLGYHDAG
jgi:hypothetical protein